MISLLAFVLAESKGSGSVKEDRADIIYTRSHSLETSMFSCKIKRTLLTYVYAVVYPYRIGHKTTQYFFFSHSVRLTVSVSLLIF